MEFFIARQPILTADLRVWAYELLFRSGRDNVFPAFDPDGATAQVVNTALCVFGPGSLTGGLTAFLNCTRRVVLDEVYTLLPREAVVLELLESAELDTALLDACKRLVGGGYRLALDDFVDHPERRPFVELCEFIKVDFRATDPDERARIAREFSASCTLIAEKVETQAEADEARELGYRYLQGYFYCRPEILSRRESFGQRAACMQLMQELCGDELDRGRIGGVIRRDPQLTVKLLRLANSAAFGPRVPTESISHALSIIGDNALRQWGTVLSLCVLAAEQPSVLLHTCLSRARLCETLAVAARPSADGGQAFLVAVLSLVDALTGRPLAELCRELNVAPSIERAVSAGEGTLGRILELAISVDRADSERAQRAAAELGIAPETLVSSYAETVRWVSEICGTLTPGRSGS